MDKFTYKITVTAATKEEAELKMNLFALLGSNLDFNQTRKFYNALKEKPGLIEKALKFI